MLRLLHLNVEGSRHFERIYPFLEKQKPDVVCMQELPEGEVIHLAKILNADSFFLRLREIDGDVQGVGIFSRYPIVSQKEEWYGGSKDELPIYDDTNYGSRYTTSRYSVAVCDIEKEGERYRIATTHFPVSKHGEVDEYQKAAFKGLLPVLETCESFILTGDFNAPRGGEIFSALAARYTDNVPKQYETSIDTTLHRAVCAGKKDEIIDKMVDGLFSTDGYTVSEVEMICGVSDHCALVATISKKDSDMIP